MKTGEIGWESAPPVSNRKGHGRKSVALAAHLAILCTACVLPARHLFAQAAPGPMAPAQPQPPSQQSASPKKEQTIQARKTLAGFWKLNSDESDDAKKKLEDASRSGGGGMGGGRRAGGGYPFPGGRGPYGGGRPLGGQDTENREQMQNMIRPPDLLTIVLMDPEVRMTGDQGQKLVFYTDGRKIQKLKDETTQEISARWDGNQLVSDEKSPRGGKMSRTFELSSGGLQLSETWRIETNRSNSPLVIRYTYDAATQNPR